MDQIKIFEAEYKFMNIIWERSPLSSAQLVKVANKEFGWKKSTTYTVIRRLCDRGAIKNENSVVSALVNRQQVMQAETKEHLDKVYNGSLKLFFASFLQKEKLTDGEVDELRNIISKYDEENGDA